MAISGLSTNRKGGVKSFFSEYKALVLFLLAALITITIVIGGSVWYYFTTDARAYHHAQDLVENGNYEEAEIAYEQFLTEFPESKYCNDVEDGLISLYVQWSQDLSRQGEYSLAEQLLQEHIANNTFPIALENALVDVYLAWGKALDTSGNYAESLSCYQTILDEYPECGKAGEAALAYEDAVVLLSEAWNVQEKYEDSSSALVSAITRYPNSEEIASQLVDTYLLWSVDLIRNGKANEAITVLLDSLVMLPQTPRRDELEQTLITATLEQEKALAEAVQYEGCTSMLENVLAQLPGSQEIGEALLGRYQEWGQLLVEEGNFEIAVQVYEKIITRWPDSSEAEEAEEHLPGLYLAWADVMAVDIPVSLDESIALYEEIIENYPGTTIADQATNHLANLYTDMGLYYIEQAALATQDQNLEGTRSALQQSKTAFENARDLNLNIDIARVYIAQFSTLDLQTAMLYVLHKGDTLTTEIEVDLQTSEYISESSGTHVIYNGGTASTWVGVELLGARGNWENPGEAGLRSGLESVTYTIQLSVPKNLTLNNMFHQVYVSTTLYYEDIMNYYDYYNRPEIEIIERQNIVFYVLVP